MSDACEPTIIEGGESVGAELQADRLADQILSGADAPDVRVYVALRGWIAFARGSGAFTPAERHLEALKRLPPEADLLAWNASDARAAKMRALD